MSKMKAKKSKSKAVSSVETQARATGEDTISAKTQRLNVDGLVGEARNGLELALLAQRILTMEYEAPAQSDEEIAIQKNQFEEGMHVALCAIRCLDRELDRLVKAVVRETVGGTLDAAAE